MVLRNAKRDTSKRILALIAIALWVILPANCVRAVSGDGLIAYPTTADPNNALSQSWFIYSLNQGESKEDYLTIKNESTEEQSVSIYAVDATTNNMGEFALEDENATRDNIGKWISTETNHLVLKPKEEKQVKFNISIPTDAAAGEISGGIIIQKDLTEAQKNTKSGFVINTRIGIRVYETVPGETIRKASFSGSSVAYNEKDRTYIYSVTIKNEGNVSLDSTVTANIKDTLFGKQNQVLEQKISIPRGEEQKVLFTIDKAKIGKFEASSELEYQKTDGSKETIANPDKVSFYAFPQELIPIIALLFLVNLIFIVILKLKRRKNKKYRKEYQIKDGDNLENLADRLDTSWQKIAKMNKLKPPYQIEEGQTIIIIDKNDVLSDSDVFIKSQVLTEPTDQVRQDRKEAFDKDLALISDQEDFSSPASDKPQTSKKIFGALLLVIILAALGYAVYAVIVVKKNNADFVYNRNQGNASPANEEPASEPQTGTAPQAAANTATGAEKPSDTAVGEINAADRQAAKIDILNGSGVKGASSKVSALFKAKGYALLTSGNADRFDYAKTTIQCGSAIKPAICQEAKEIVSGAYPSAEIKQGSASANTDKIIITLGK